MNALSIVARAPVVAARAGLLAPVRPDRLPRMAAAVRHGPGLSALVALGAARHPNRPAVIDEDGPLSFAELDREAARVAGGLLGLAAGRAGSGSRGRGFRPGGGDEPGTLALLCRNHRGLVIGLIAGARLGWRFLLVNYELSPGQLARVLERERPRVVFHDDEYASRLSEFDPAVPRAVAEEPPVAPAPRPSLSSGGILLLTSGTTGLPKGAAREAASPLALLDGLGIFVSIIGRSRIRAGQPVLCGPPGFHAFGLGVIVLGLAFGGGVIMRRRFDPEQFLADAERYKAGVAMAVPVMLKRMLDLPAEVRRRYDFSSVQTVISGAAPLSPALAEAFLDEFGDVLYNGYGTTENGLATFATPWDLREAPGTVGRPVDGIPVKVLGPDGREVPPGEVGGLYVGGRLIIRGYTGGGTLKDKVGGMLNTGDLAHRDEHGRIFIDGRQDDMIVSGGENVFPGEVEDALASHPAVADVAVVGVPDEEFGQRLVAFVVRGEEEVDADALLGYLKGCLERYKTPRSVNFVDAIPRNPSGKILRRELLTSLDA